jgi:UbiD family decarboxylase
VRKFIEELKAADELAIVDREVNGRFELAAVIKGVQRTSEQAVLFERVAGSRMRVASNLYGNHARLARLIGACDRPFTHRWSELQERPLMLSQATERLPFSADRLSGKLTDLPMITYHGHDAGPYITSGIFVAKDPDTGVPNLSFHRSMFVSDTELRIRLGTSHDLYRYQAKAEARGEFVEAAMLIGVEPEIFLAACSSPPHGISELETATKITGKPVPVMPCRTVDVEVPVHTEVIVEGRILPNVRRSEGPFGEFMGYYVPAGDNHVFEITDVHWRPDPIVHAIVCGSAEDLRALEAVTAARIYRHVSSVVSGILDVSCRPNVMITIIKLRKAYEGHAGHALLAAVGSHLDYNKICIAVDEDVDIQNIEEVIWAFMTRGRVDTRTTIIGDIPGFYRDPHKDHWGRLLIDATAPWGREADFHRKRIPGEDSIRLEDYLRPRR